MFLTLIYCRTDHTKRKDAACLPFDPSATLPASILVVVAAAGWCRCLKPSKKIASKRDHAGVSDRHVQTDTVDINVDDGREGGRRRILLLGGS